MSPAWHVLLLPADADRRWWEAARLYIERFRVVPLADPAAVLALQGEPVVVTLVLPDGRPGSTAAWLRERRPDLRLDVVQAPTPEILQRILEARTAAGMRLGRGLRARTTDRLNIRQAPSRSAPIIGRLEAGAEVMVVGRSPDGEWWAIVDPVRRGRAWIAAAYAEVVAGAAEALPVLLAQPPVVRVRAAVPVRREPDPRAPALGTLAPGAEGEALGRTEDGLWVQIAYPDAARTGWVPAAALEAVRGSLAEVPAVPSLRWLHPPVTPPILHRGFGAEPEVFARWGLPGHEGIDFQAPPGEPVRAAAAGLVLRAGEIPGHPYGAQVRLQHHRPDGVYVTVYGHLMPGSIEVMVGTWVQAGQRLARAGSQGFIHFALKKEGGGNGAYGDFVDPTPHLMGPLEGGPDPAAEGL